MAKKIKFKFLNFLFRSFAFWADKTGGEPFLSQRFHEIVLFCRMEGKSVTIISNGTQGSAADYRQLVRMGVGLFELPVYSVQADIHDRMVQRFATSNYSRHQRQYSFVQSFSCYSRQYF